MEGQGRGLGVFPRRDDLATRRQRLYWLDKDRKLVARVQGLSPEVARYFDRHERAIRAGYPFGDAPAPWEDIALEFAIPLGAA